MGAKASDRGKDRAQHRVGNRKLGQFEGVGAGAAHERSPNLISFSRRPGDDQPALAYGNVMQSRKVASLQAFTRDCSRGLSSWTRLHDSRVPRIACLFESEPARFGRLDHGPFHAGS